MSWNDDMTKVVRNSEVKEENVGSKKPNEWASCRNLDWEMLWAVSAGVKTCTLLLSLPLSLHCPGITSDKSRDEENKANTSSGPLSLLARVGDRRVRNVCYMSTTTRKTQPETTPDRWKEETHALLTKNIKIPNMWRTHSIVWIQTKHMWKILVVTNQTKPESLYDISKVCGTVTLKFPGDVCWLCANLRAVLKNIRRHGGLKKKYVHVSSELLCDP